jgi:hypothetical protein
MITCPGTYVEKIFKKVVTSTVSSENVAFRDKKQVETRPTIMVDGVAIEVVVRGTV